MQNAPVCEVYEQYWVKHIRYGGSVRWICIDWQLSKNIKCRREKLEELPTESNTLHIPPSPSRTVSDVTPTYESLHQTFDGLTCDVAAR